MRPGYLVAFWLLVLGATSIRVDALGAVTDQSDPSVSGVAARTAERFFLALPGE